MSCARLRPTTELADPEQATKVALRRLARRHQHLTQEITEADAELKNLVTAAAPRLLALPGVGIEVAGQLLTTAGDNPDRLRCEAAFAHLCGVAPIPASSGRTHRHRLNRGGDRAANNALYIIVLGRLRYHLRTREYADRRTKEGLSKPEIIRCLKRYVAREVYTALQPDKQQKNRAQVAESFFGAPKNELIHRTVFPTRHHARREVVKYIEGFYNRRRLHSGLGYRTPFEVYTKYLNSQLAA